MAKISKADYISHLVDDGGYSESEIKNLTIAKLKVLTENDHSSTLLKKLKSKSPKRSVSRGRSKSKSKSPAKRGRPKKSPKRKSRSKSKSPKRKSKSRSKSPKRKSRSSTPKRKSKSPKRGKKTKSGEGSIKFRCMKQQIDVFVPEEDTRLIEFEKKGGHTGFRRSATCPECGASLSVIVKNPNN
jgi:hypothetical protein